MRKYKKYPLSNHQNFKNKLLSWGAQHDVFINLESNELSGSYTSYECIAAVGAKKSIEIQKEGDAFESLKQFHNENKDWLFGNLAYDLKNEIEDLCSNHQDRIEMPALHFFQPQWIFFVGKDQVEIGYLEGDVNGLVDEINAFINIDQQASDEIHLESKIKREEYIQKVEQVKDHIQQGNIYEMNFCQEFYADNVLINPVEVYIGLNEKSPAPFSCFYKYMNKYLISSSPERFLKKEGNKIISQPIKGTAKRGKSDVEDLILKEFLAGNAKEQSENVMIVDLVRNDLSRSAKLGTVQVEELFGIYSFEQVHQMISTVSAELKDDIHFVDVIKNAFPMGSMTGAPKVRSMELIEEFEESKRGLFSGSIGYITPSGDFDFNVIIRSILYNEEDQYVSFTTGSAITTNSNAEKEYEECLLKGKALRQVLNSTYV